MPLKGCLKAAPAAAIGPSEPIANLTRTGSYVDYHALPFAQPSVHFPPSPVLVSSTHLVDRYDRTPIVVSENSCALPKRGCPGRTYAASDHCPLRAATPRPSKTKFMTGACGPEMTPSPLSTSIPRHPTHQMGGGSCQYACPPYEHLPMCIASQQASNAYGVRQASSQRPTDDGLYTRATPSSFASSWDSTSSCLEGF